MPFIGEPIQLLEQQRTELNEIAQSRSLPAGFVFRAKLILMLAEGEPFPPSNNDCRRPRRRSRAGNSGLETGTARSGHISSGTIGGRTEASTAREDPDCDTQKAETWLDTWELPQAVGGDQRE